MSIAPQNEKLQFEDFFDLTELQKIQDSFALATGVAALITTPGGQPITKPSSFCRLCAQIIRGSERGLRNCQYSDAIVCAHNPQGPTVRRCLSSGLWDAGVSITVRGVHVASWMVGQVRSTDDDDKQLHAYAQTIGVSEEEYRTALAEVPRMPERQFRAVVDALFLLANALSEKAYQAWKLREEQRERANTAALLEQLMRHSRDGIVIVDQDHRIIDANVQFAAMLGYPLHEMVGLHTWDYDALSTETQIREVFNEFPRINDRFETQHRRKDGSVYDVEVSVNGIQMGERSFVLGVCRDISERKAADRALRQSEERSRALFEISRDGYVLVDPQCRVLEANDAYCQLTGYSVDELRALPDFYAFTPEKWWAWQKREIWQERVLVTGDSGVYRKEYIRKDGVVISVELRDHAVYDDAGKIKYVWGTVRDISAREQADNWQRTLMQIVEQSPASVVMTDTDGRVEYVNSKFIALSGYALEEVQGQNIRSLSSGEKPLPGQGDLWTALSAGREWRGEFHNRRKDGSPYWEAAFIFPILDVGGQRTHYVAIKEDVTLRREAEEGVRQRDVMFQKLIDSLPQMVSWVDSRCRYRFVNKSYRDFFSSTDVVGRHVRDVVGEAAFVMSASYIKRALGGELVQYSTVFPYTEGECYCEAYLIPDHDAHGVVAGYYAVVTDLSQVKAMEKSLREAKDQAEAASRLKSEFLANTPK